MWTAEPPIDDTNINDGNDGVTIPGSTTNISVSPLNTSGKDTYVEIPPGGTLTFDDGARFFLNHTPSGYFSKDNQMLESYYVCTVLMAQLVFNQVNFHQMQLMMQ